jgi:hypothetical protein
LFGDITAQKKAAAASIDIVFAKVSGHLGGAFSSIGQCLNMEKLHFFG